MENEKTTIAEKIIKIIDYRITPKVEVIDGRTAFVEFNSLALPFEAIQAIAKHYKVYCMQAPEKDTIRLFFYYK